MLLAGAVAALTATLFFASGYSSLALLLHMLGLVTLLASLRRPRVAVVGGPRS